jgi:hypothetical protein
MVFDQEYDAIIYFTTESYNPDCPDEKRIEWNSSEINFKLGYQVSLINEALIKNASSFINHDRIEIVKQTLRKDISRFLKRFIYKLGAVQKVIVADFLEPLFCSFKKARKND